MAIQICQNESEHDYSTEVTEKIQQAFVKSEPQYLIQGVTFIHKEQCDVLLWFTKIIKTSLDGLKLWNSIERGCLSAYFGTYFLRNQAFIWD